MSQCTWVLAEAARHPGRVRRFNEGRLQRDKRNRSTELELNTCLRFPDTSQKARSGWPATCLLNEIKLWPTGSKPTWPHHSTAPPASVSLGGSALWLCDLYSRQYPHAEALLDRTLALVRWLAQATGRLYCSDLRLLPNFGYISCQICKFLASLLPCLQSSVSEAVNGPSWIPWTPSMSHSVAGAPGARRNRELVFSAAGERVLHTLEGPGGGRRYWVVCGHLRLQDAVLHPKYSSASTTSGI